MKQTLLIFGLHFLFQFAIGQEMITDFLYREGDRDSHPSNFVEFNQKLFFQATSDNVGREIWMINENKVSLLKDINPGKNSGIRTSFSEISVLINNTLYFIANDGLSDGEIWKTDGTTEGTEKVTSFLNSNISKLTLVGENFYFLIKDGYSLQVWISDGSAEGTKIVKDNIPIWNTPTFQGKCNNTFIFTFQPKGSNYSRVWRSDGSSEGTFPITEEIDGNGSGPGGTSSLTQYIEFNNELYFISRNFLHKTDGTLENTVDVTTFHSASSRLINHSNVIKYNGKLYFSFFEVDYNRFFIWETDGTEEGSKNIYDVYGNTKYLMTSNLVGKDENLIFCGANESGGFSLVKLNLTDYSVNYVKELQDNADSPYSFLKNLMLSYIWHMSDGRIFCSSLTNLFERQGWISGCTEETTSNIESLNGAVSIFNFDNSNYFSKRTELEGSELWQSDGTENGTKLVENINKSKYGLINKPLISLNSNLIFLADDGSIGEELWKFNGNNNVLIKNIREGSFGSQCKSFIKYKDEIFFNSYDTINGSELWKTNGDETGTKVIHDIIEGSGSSNPEYFTIHKGVLYFIAYKERHYHLCSSDGKNFQFIKDLGENQYGVGLRVEEMKSSGEYLYFVTNGGDLWISDGTEAGSNKLKDFYSCTNLTNVNGKLYFKANEIYTGEEELWVTEGTEAETKLVKDIGVGYSSKPEDLINYNGVLFFTAYTNDSGRELWKSDGSENGTLQLVDIIPGSQGSLKNANFCLVNSTLFFVANDGSNGFELWKTDGSESGTLMVKDINPGNESSFPAELTEVKDLVYFQAYDVEHGVELWKSDGTETGTMLVADIFPGIYNSSPTNIHVMDDDVFFIAESQDAGRQIWKIKYNVVTSNVEFSDVSGISVYPNPFIDYIYIKADAKIQNIHLYNSNGQMVYIKKEGNDYINISHLPTGLYIMKFDTDGKCVTKKIIKQ